MSDDYETGTIYQTSVPTACILIADQPEGQRVTFDETKLRNCHRKHLVSGQTRVRFIRLAEPDNWGNPAAHFVEKLPPSEQPVEPAVKDTLEFSEAGHEHLEQRLTSE